MSEALDVYSDDDKREMLRVTRIMVKALMPLKDHIKPLLVAMALLQIARSFVRRMDKEAQKEVLPTLCSYLEGRTQLPDDPSQAGQLWTPGGRGKRWWN